MKKACVAVLVLCWLAGQALWAQTIQVDRKNRTIAVTADDQVQADAEIASVQIGYHNYAQTKDAVYDENLRVSEKVVAAILAAGVPKHAIHTEKLSLGREQIDEIGSPKDKVREPRFEARQTWKIRVAAAQAQALVDVAVRAGANEIENVDWFVLDPVTLQAKAGEAALSKARKIAEQMATGLGAKLLELVYASNRAQALFNYATVSTETVEVRALAPPPPPPHLRLFPEKVSQSATVYAVFAIE